jgi:hypothetical protein
MEGNVAHMGELGNLYKIVGGKPKRPLGRPRILRKWGMRMRTEFIWLRIGTSGGLL